MISFNFWICPVYFKVKKKPFDIITRSKNQFKLFRYFCYHIFIILIVLLYELKKASIWCNPCLKFTFNINKYGSLRSEFRRNFWKLTSLEVNWCLPFRWLIWFDWFDVVPLSIGLVVSTEQFANDYFCLE